MPHVGRNKIRAFLEQQGAHPDTKHCKATSKSETCIFKVRYRTASLELLSAQSAPEEGVDAAPTLSQWFGANIKVIVNEDDVFHVLFAVHAATAQVANVDEQAVTRFFKSTGLQLELLPRSTPDGKVIHTWVVSGGRWKVSESDAKFRGEEGTFQQFLTWFDNPFVISPGSSPSVKWKFWDMPTSPSHIE